MNAFCNKNSNKYFYVCISKVFSLLALAIAHAFAAFLGTPSALLAARFSASLLIGMFMLSAGAATADLLVRNPEQLASESAIGMAVLSGGLALGVPLSSVLPQRLCWPYGMSAVLSAIGGVLLLSCLSETRPEGAARPFNPRLALRAPLSCVRLFRISRQLAMLSGLLAVLLLPLFSGDALQVHALERWGLTSGQRAQLFTLFGASAVASNGLASLLIKRVGIRDFTALATISHGLLWAGVGHSHRFALFATLPGLLGGARSLGVSTLITSVGSQLGLPQGELAGDRANLFALLKVVGPVLYTQLYVRGKALGLPELPFIFNVALMGAATVLARALLPTAKQGIARASKIL